MGRKQGKWVERWEEIREKWTVEEIIEDLIGGLVRVVISPIEVRGKEVKPIEQPIIIYGDVQLENGEEVQVRTKNGLGKLRSHRLLLKKYYPVYPVKSKRGRIPFSEVWFLPLNKVYFSKVYATSPPIAIDPIPRMSNNKVIVYELRSEDSPPGVEYIKGVMKDNITEEWVEKKPTPMESRAVLEPGDFIDLIIRPYYSYREVTGKGDIITYRGHLYMEKGRSRRSGTPIVGGNVRIRVKAENLTEKEKELCRELARRIYEEEFPPRWPLLSNIFFENYKAFYNAVKFYRMLVARKLEEELYQ